jgi:signal transduction histidine kinase
MKLLLKISLLLLLPLFATAQKQLDSLHTALKTAANDTIKMLTLGQLGNYYSESNWDSALLFTEQALAISTMMNQSIWTANFLLNKSYFLGKQGNLPLALKLTNEALQIAQDEKNEKNIYIPKEDQGDILASDPHTVRLNILAGAYHIFGNQYVQAGNKEKAITYYKKEIQVAEEIKNNGLLVNSNMNIGSIYLSLGKLDSAQFYSFKALKYSNSTGYKLYQGNILMTIGDSYFKGNQIDSAKYYYLYSLSLSKEQNNKADEADVNFSLAELYGKLHKPDSMLFYGKTALSIATNLKAPVYIRTSTKTISDAYKMLGNVDSAFAYLSISKALGDSLNADRNEKLTQFQNIGFDEQMRLEKAEQESIAYKNRMRTIILYSGLGVLALLAFIFFRNTRQKQKANKVLESTLTNLKSTQSQLIQSEKMASLGVLTAGIAHEIQNPLNFVNNFSEVNKELLAEMKDEIDKGNLNEIKALANNLIDNQEKINHHGKRADAIVKGMLQHSRSSSGVKEPTDINVLANEYLRLAYHGLRAKDKSFNANFKTDFDTGIEKINVVPQDIGRVILNLINNAFYAVNEKKQTAGNNYEPTVTITTKKVNNKIEIRIKDNGNGIPQKVLDKIFQPFFTTKPTGQGTGLGLSLSYDIVKAHGGELKVETKEGEGSEFIIELAIK